MLTRAQQEAAATEREIRAERLNALIFALNAEAKDARQAADAAGRDNTHLRAALTGKKNAYIQAAQMVEAIRDGRGLRPRRYSTARRMADAYRERRARRLGGAS